MIYKKNIYVYINTYYFTLRVNESRDFITCYEYLMQLLLFIQIMLRFFFDKKLLL